MQLVNSVVEKIVSSGLVMPTVITTSANAQVTVLRRGSAMTGESCEMLSRPENAKNAPENPVSMTTGVMEPANISPITWPMACSGTLMNTATMITTSVTKAATATVALTRALSRIPHQFSMPSNARTSSVAGSTYGLMPVKMASKYCKPESEMIAEIRK